MDIQIEIFIVNLIISAIVAFLAVSFRIGKYQEKVDSLKEDKDKHSKKIDTLKTDVDQLLEFKVQTQKFIDNKLFQSNSPLTLTPLGEKLVKESGFKVIFGNVKDDLLNKLEKQNPKTKYDTQEKSRALLDGLLEYEAFKPIKTYAFNTGQDYAQILRAGSILLRNYYFKKHPELKE